MSERTTAEIVADMREFLAWYKDNPEPGIPLAIPVWARHAADRLAELDAEVTKLRNEVGTVMRREKKIRASFAKWTHRLTRRIQKLKANIDQEEAFINALRAENAELRQSVKP